MAATGLLTAKEARIKLNVNEHAFKKAVDSGALPYVLLPGGRRKLFTDDDLAEFIESQKRRTPWQSGSGKVRGSTNMNSSSTVVGFAEALRRKPSTQPRR